MKKWYVIQTKPMREDEVDKRLSLSDADIETFNPKIKSFVGSRSSQVCRAKPLFPSYIFARGDLWDANLHHMVKYTRGVNKVLRCGELPVPVPDEVIEIIKGRVGEGGFIEQQAVFKPGDHVRVRRGILKDLIGILEKPVTAAGRVAVLLRIMNRQMRAILGCADVERV